MGGKYTDSQKKAANKYMAEKVEEIKIRVPKGEKENIKVAAERAGKSVNAYILDAVHEKMSQSSND